MLATLGFFPFMLRTIPFQTISRQNGWRHPEQSTVSGGINPVQYIGPDTETITLSAELRPEITGGDTSLSMLRLMAERGKPYNLILGTGQIMGAYVITSIKEDRGQLMHDSKARAISFSLELKKVSDSPLGLKGKALQLGVSIARRIAGI